MCSCLLSIVNVTLSEYHAGLWTVKERRLSWEGYARNAPVLAALSTWVRKTSIKPSTSE
jgi:hypothetical protein